MMNQRTDRRTFIRGVALGVAAVAAGGGRADGRAGARPSLGPVITDFEVRRKEALAPRQTAFFIDDVIWVLRDIARQRPDSIFDHPLLGGLRAAHERYGLKVQLNLFYRTDFFYGTDEFSLAEMPDAYRGEWQSAKEWLRLGFHSLQEFPDYPFVNADYRDVKCVFDRIRGEVQRFAGEGTFTTALVGHWLPISKDGCRALADSGVKVIYSTDGERFAYDESKDTLPYGHAFRLMNNRKVETALFTRTANEEAIRSSICGYNHLSPEQARATLGTFNAVYDRDTKVCYKCFRNGPMLNLCPFEELETALAPVIGSELIVCGDHEQYFHKEYYAYQPEYLKKIDATARYLREAGYTYLFIEDTV